MIKIKQVVFKSHCDILRTLQLATLPGDTPWMEPSSWYWLAYDDDTPVAFAALSLSRSQSPKDGVYLARAWGPSAGSGARPTAAPDHRQVQFRTKTGQAVGLHRHSHQPLFVKQLDSLRLSGV